MRILIFSFLVLRIRADSFVIIETSSRFCSIVLPLLIVICITGNSKLDLNSVKASCNVYIFSVACLFCFALSEGVDVAVFSAHIQLPIQRRMEYGYAYYRYNLRFDIQKKHK